MSKKLYSTVISYINADSESMVTNCLPIASNKNEAIGIAMSNLTKEYPNIKITNYTIMELSDKTFDGIVTTVHESRKV